MKIDASYLRQLDRFRIVLKQRVITKYQGQHESTLAGEGLIFKDHAIYAPGDDIRKIDWNVYARTEKLFVRRYEEERNMLTHVIVDASKSMDFGKPMSKFEYAAMLGLGFAYLTMRDNGRFNFATFSDKLEIIKSDHGKNIMKIINHLNSLGIGGKTNLVDSLMAYKNQINTKSLLVIISDFLYDIKDIKEIMLRYKKNYIYLIQVLDPEEIELTLKGDVILKDMESSVSLRTFVSNRLRESYKKRLKDHMLEIKDICVKSRSAFITAPTNQTVFDSFYNILFHN